MPTKRFSLLLLLGAVMMAGQVHAAADPGAAKIEAFDASLLDSMKAGPGLGMAERYRRMAPVIERTFNLPVMTQFAVGPAWSGFTPAQQQAAIAAFTRLTTASYAHNFNAYGGERFEVDANVITRGPDKIVNTHLIRPHDAPVALSYRMRAAGDSWKVIDIYYGAISQLTTRRSDFAGSIASGGAPALIAHLTSLTDRLMN
ncbi:MAG TPA: ABC transporter substrate-binding protein [Caulobacteraceae bacterium]|jgi:phospholipid transport system substrate-binding protein